VIDRPQVVALAAAAGIHLDAEEMDRIAAQLSDILEQMSRIIEIGREPETSPDVEQYDTIAATPQPLRADVPGADALAGTLSRFAPDVREGFFTVPLVPTHAHPVTDTGAT
jgi:aspartyl/glutamyl-tRNA(Asn/Gln) amidotransferase C subunit